MNSVSLLDQLLLSLTEDASFTHDAKGNIVFLTSNHRLSFAAKKDQLKIEKMPVSRLEIPQFIQYAAQCSERSFSLSYQKEFPQDFLRVSELVENIINARPVSDRYKVHQKDRTILIEDTLYKQKNTAHIHLPSDFHMGNYNVECHFYPFPDATSCMRFCKFLIPELDYSLIKKIPPKELPDSYDKVLKHLKNIPEKEIQSKITHFELNFFLPQKEKTKSLKI